MWIEISRFENQKSNSDRRLRIKNANRNLKNVKTKTHVGTPRLSGKISNKNKKPNKRAEMAENDG